MLRQSLLAALTGILAGLAATVFLMALAAATLFREIYPQIIYGLPLIGLLIGWVYHTYGRDSQPGTNLILDEIHRPSRRLPLKMAPLILVSTLLTHLFGGSAGREGTVVQMGASLSDQLAQRETPAHRQALLQAGAGAGFAAAIGAPFAGMVFGLEVIGTRSQAYLQCAIAALVGYGTTLLLHAPHTPYPSVHAPAFGGKSLAIAAVAGVFFGLAARAFVLVTHAVEKLQQRFVRYPPLRPFVGGVFLLGLFLLTPTTRYEGLGLPVIQQALTETVPWWDAPLKALFTALTIGSGFKGGEFIPLVFIGTTMGSALGYSWLAAVGFSAVFGAAANTPLACAVMGVEIFGWRMAPYALLAGFIAYAVSGHPGIYKSQPRVPPRSVLGWWTKLS